jgi:hypothetical protein
MGARVSSRLEVLLSLAIQNYNYISVITCVLSLWLRDYWVDCQIVFIVLSVLHTWLSFDLLFPQRMD